MPVDPIIERINELARKSRAEGLTDEERLEQQRLRRQYIEAFRRGLDATLDGVFVEDQNGQAVPIKEYMRERYGAKEKDTPKA